MIRVVIGSYFMAISLGLINGIAPAALFVSLAESRIADLIGTILLFAVTVCFMGGIWLRITSLILAIFVLATSVAQNFVHPAQPLIEPFWRDLTLVCAVLLSYSSLKRSEIRNAALLGRKPRYKAPSSDQVAPRRVSPTRVNAKRGEQTDYVKSMKPLMQGGAAAQIGDAAEEPEILLLEDARRKTVPKASGSRFQDDVENIFAAL